ncbi:unnamed protein product [Nezara viridula]|nr:unnamed protein product [Nezara viridula]
MHIGVAAAAFGVSYMLQKWYDIRNMEKDAVYRHYIALHPDDFPMPERKKVGEIFPKFVPIR